MPYATLTYVVQDTKIVSPSDLAVISWNGAFLYDSASGAETVIQLLEYANSQLLEFRHYDELLTRELDGVYKSLKSKASFWRRWACSSSTSRRRTTMR